MRNVVEVWSLKKEACRHAETWSAGLILSGHIM